MDPFSKVPSSLFIRKCCYRSRPNSLQTIVISKKLELSKKNRDGMFESVSGITNFSVIAALSETLIIQC